MTTAQLETSTRDAELLKMEYEHLAESFFQNEAEGEKRAMFFITLAGAAVAALGLFLKGDPGPSTMVLHVSIGLTLFVLVLFGRITIARIIRRNLSTEDFLRGLANIRSFFVAEDERLAEHLLFDPSAELKLHKFDPVGRGGWLETVTAVVSILVGALAVIVISGVYTFVRPGIEPGGEFWAVTVLIGLACAGAAWLRQAMNANSRYKDGRTDRSGGDAADADGANE